MSIKVYPRQNENIRSTLKRLRKICEKEGIVKELRKRAYYEKPSDKNRRQRQQAIRRSRQSELSQQQSKKMQRQNSQKKNP